MIDLALLVGKILFLVVLYWFVLMVVRSATADLRAVSAPAAVAPPRGVPAPPGGHGGRWALVASSSPVLGPGWFHELRPGDRAVVGRSEEADVVLRDTFVSSRHVRVRALPGAVEIEDLGSTNGTFVNGEEIDGTVLVGPGDEVSVGDTVFRVEAR